MRDTDKQIDSKMEMDNMSIHRSENVRNANKECGMSVWKQVMERERLIERERERERECVCV